MRKNAFGKNFGEDLEAAGNGSWNSNQETIVFLSASSFLYTWSQFMPLRGGIKLPDQVNQVLAPAQATKRESLRFLARWRDSIEEYFMLLRSGIKLPDQVNQVLAPAQASKRESP